MISGRSRIEDLDFDFLKSCDDDLREKVLRESLGHEKCKLIDKYGLTSNRRLYWEKVQEKYPTQEYFSTKLAKKTSTLGIVFHIHRLCFAKTKYFEANWKDYEPCKYVWKEAGFVECELYDLEAIRQKATGIVIDLRDLARISWLSDFEEMCKELEWRKNQASIKSVELKR